MADAHRSNEQAEIIIEDESLRQGFTQIPNALLRRADVTAGAKITYMALLSYAWGKDRCFPGQETLAHDVGAGRRSVIRYLQELQEVGLLEIKRRGLGLTNIYVLKKMAVTSRSAILAHQEVPTPTHQEMPKWQTEEDSVEEDSRENTLSTNRRSTRSINKNVDNSVSHDITSEAPHTNGYKAEPVKEWRGMEPVGDVLKRKRGRPRKYADQESQTILNYVADFSREFADQATLQKSASRIINDYQKWGRGDISTFIGVLYQARATTKEHSAAIRGSKFAYFCSVVEDLLGLRDDQAVPALHN